MYDPMMIQPMRDELDTGRFLKNVNLLPTQNLFQKKKPKSMIYVLNSVCGCSAATARPGVVASLQGDILPEYLVTSFAGNDVEAVQRVREEFIGYPPSSPCIALFKDGQFVELIERHQIQGEHPEAIAGFLTAKNIKNTSLKIKKNKKRGCLIDRGNFFFM